MGQCPRVEDQQSAVHVAKTLFVLVNKFTLRAPFHATLLEWAVSMGPADGGSWSEWLSAGFQSTP